MNFRAVCFAVLFVAAAAMPAWADIDQLCLKQCVSSGSGSGTCLSKCSYGDATPQSSTPKPTPPPQTHRSVHTPIPIDRNTLVGKKPLTPPPPEKDYACFQDCLHSGQVYGYCERQCTKMVCPPGSVTCQDRPGLANSPNAVPPGASTPSLPLATH